MQPLQHESVEPSEYSSDTDCDIYSDDLDDIQQDEESAEEKQREIDDEEEMDGDEDEEIYEEDTEEQDSIDDDSESDYQESESSGEGDKYCDVCERQVDRHTDHQCQDCRVYVHKRCYNENLHVKLNTHSNSFFHCVLRRHGNVLKCYNCNLPMHEKQRLSECRTCHRVFHNRCLAGQSVTVGSELFQCRICTRSEATLAQGEGIPDFAANHFSEVAHHCGEQFPCDHCGSKIWLAEGKLCCEHGRAVIRDSECRPPPSFRGLYEKNAQLLINNGRQVNQLCTVTNIKVTEPVVRKVDGETRVTDRVNIGGQLQYEEKFVQMSGIVSHFDKVPVGRVTSDKYSPLMGNPLSYIMMPSLSAEALRQKTSALFTDDVIRLSLEFRSLFAQRNAFLQSLMIQMKHYLDHLPDSYRFLGGRQSWSNVVEKVNFLDSNEVFISLSEESGAQHQFGERNMSLLFNSGFSNIFSTPRIQSEFIWKTHDSMSNFNLHWGIDEKEYEQSTFMLLDPCAFSGYFKSKGEQYQALNKVMNSYVPISRARYIRSKMFQSEFQKYVPRLFEEWILDQVAQLKYSTAFEAQKWKQFHYGVTQRDANRINFSKDTMQLYSVSKNVRGSFKDRQHQIAKGMLQVYQSGIPTLFITFTANPKWPEITENLAPGQKWFHNPVLVARVFKIKLDDMIDKLKRGFFFGDVKAEFIQYSIEFQKRGIPHAHILVKLESMEYCTAAFAKKHISAKIPEKCEHDCIGNNQTPLCDKCRLNKLVLEHMMHNHKANRCFVKKDKFGKLLPRTQQECKYGYPYKECPCIAAGIQGFMSYERGTKDSMVVPHAKTLLLRYEAHINVEACAGHRSIFYLRKYLSKEPDTVQVSLTNTARDEKSELELFFKTRCYTSCEATWEGLGFTFNYFWPEVELLDIHDENFNRFFTKDNSDRSLAQIRQKAINNSSSQLLQYFKRPRGTIQMKQRGLNVNVDFDTMTFNDYYKRCDVRPCLDLLASRSPLDNCTPPNRVVLLPEERNAGVGHLNFKNNELYCLLKLLEKFSARSFADLKGNHSTYTARAKEEGLFASIDMDTNESIIVEMSQRHRSPAEIRYFLASLAQLPEYISQVPLLFLKHWKQMADPNRDVDPQWPIEKQEHFIKVETLHRLMQLLCREGIDLFAADFDPPFEFKELYADLEAYLLNSGKSRRHKMDPSIFFNITRDVVGDIPSYDTLGLDQRNVRNHILESYATHNVFYVNGIAGAGKTSLLKHLFGEFALNLNKKCLCTAFTGIAASLLPGLPLTTHRAFGLPIDDSDEIEVSDKLCVSSIKKNSFMFRVLQETDVVFIDEVSMLHRKYLELIDRLLRSLNPQTALLPFGGKLVILAGDFHQLPPVTKCKRNEVESSVLLNTPCSSQLWVDHVRPLTLEQAFRFDTNKHPSYPEELLEIAKARHNGPLPTQSTTPVELPKSIKVVSDFPERAFCNFDPVGLISPHHESVRTYNQKVMENFVRHKQEPLTTFDASYQLPGSRQVYLTPADVQDFQINNLPDHKLSVAIGMPMMILRNVNPTLKLCNGTIVVVVHVTNNAVIVKHWKDRENPEAQQHVIFRIPFSMSARGHKLARFQFPLVPAFAITINKSQGKTIDKPLYIDLRTPCFAHGQLYVAMSRIVCPSLITVINDEGSSKVYNVVYQQLLAMAHLRSSDFLNDIPTDDLGVDRAQRSPQIDFEVKKVLTKKERLQKAFGPRMLQTQKNDKNCAGVFRIRQATREVRQREIRCHNCDNCFPEYKWKRTYNCCPNCDSQIVKK